MGIVSDLSIIIVAALSGGILAALLRLPLLLGYIAAGIVIGPHLGLVQLSGLHDIELLSELGVALLLFALGLEFSLTQLRPVRKIALIGTPVQIALTIGLGYLIGSSLGWGWQAALSFGAFISVSSTVVVLKNLMNLGLLATLSAKVMVGVLIVQDLAVIPLMVLLPQLGAESADLSGIFWTVSRALLVVVVALSFGKQVLPWFLGKIARGNSRELFLISLTAVALGVSYLGHLLGFSFAFGAFVAGMALSESDHQHRALADITPIRDLFVLVFFVSVGMLLDPYYLVAHGGAVFAVVVSVMLAKGIIFYVLARLFHYGNVIPLAVAFGLSQIGEFSFVLAQLSMQANAITTDIYNLTVSAAVISMLLAPFLARAVRPVYVWLRSFQTMAEPRQIDVPDTELGDHVVIVGGGRVGTYIAQTLQSEGRRGVIIEDNYSSVIKLKDRGFAVLFGDAAQPAVLEAAQIHRARLLILAIADQRAVDEILFFLRGTELQIPIIARAHSRAEMKILHDAGVSRVVEPFFEGGLEMATQALAVLGADPADLVVLTEKLREEAYRVEG